MNKRLARLALCLCLAAELTASACITIDLDADKILVLYGEEDSSSRMHMVCIDTVRPESGVVQSGLQGRIDDVVARGGLAIIAHPTAAGFSEKVGAGTLQNFTGIEINCAEDLRLWDNILDLQREAGQGAVWAFMSDDSNNSEEFKDGCVILRSQLLRKTDVLESIRMGCFYWGTGPLINDISSEGNNISIELATEARIMFIASGGRIIKEASGSSAQYTANGDEGYIRIEAEAFDGTIAGSQPFWIGPGGNASNPYSVSGSWHKGNLHTHSSGDGGPSPRQAVIERYRENGYGFIAITDYVIWVVPTETPLEAVEL
jgi:hypothetical protein